MGYGNKVNLVWSLRPTFEQRNGLPVPLFNQTYSNYVQISPVQTQKSIDNQSQKETTTTVATTTVKKSEQAKSEKKIEVNAFCASMPFNIPKEHFKILKEKKSKNGEPFLTETQFNQFINKAFYGKADTPEAKIKLLQRRKITPAGCVL